MKWLIMCLFNCSQNIAKKSFNDADSFDDCQPSLSKLENRQAFKEVPLSPFVGVKRILHLILIIEN